MPKLYVHTPFTLRHDDGSTEQFTVGERDFSEATAAHWYVAHHTREPGDAPKPTVAPADGAELAAARAALEAQAAQLASAREDASKEAARLAALRVELDTFSKGLDERAAALDAHEAAVAAGVQDLAARVAAFEAVQKDAAAAAKDGAADGATQKSGGGKKA
ncbi:hypothetical protein [Burkholderia sp. BCC1047]|uniref:STY1053 family phage-associated protein n=1 Tax=Burkholderia sp. BCC1047 TaxID=2676299 RepID=UPI00158A93E2|nr:hypothetical protein [Burkholderia sp. BCC1047]